MSFALPPVGSARGRPATPPDPPAVDVIRDLPARARQLEPPPPPRPDPVTAAAVVTAARTAVAATPATSSAERFLRTLNARRRPALPPADVMRGWDDRLADLITRAHDAEGAAHRAEIDWLYAQPGGVGFAALATARHADTVAHLDTHDGDAPPVAADTPLVEHLERGVHRLYVEALDAATRAEWCDQRARDYARAATDLLERLDLESDAIRDRMAVHLLAAADRKSRFELEQARQLRPAWGEASALYVWVGNPTAAYVDRRYTPGPAQVGALEWIALGELGEPRDAVYPGDPDPELLARWQKQYAPPGEETATAPPRRRLFGIGQP